MFHARWEGRVVALTGATGGTFVPNVDKFRHAIERMDPVEYLSAGYYGRWLRAIETRLVEAGELEPGAVDRRARELAARSRAGRSERRSAAARVRATRRRLPMRRTPADPRRRRTSVRGRAIVARSIDAPRFAAGDAVSRAHDHPAGHTRLPRYVRGKTRAHRVRLRRLRLPRHQRARPRRVAAAVYCVAFRGEELWGADAEPGTCVHLDLFETYLEPVDRERAP